MAPASKPVVDLTQAVVDCWANLRKLGLADSDIAAALAPLDRVLKAGEDTSPEKGPTDR